MGHIIPNIAKGRFVELVNRVKSNDPSTSVLVLVPLETAGLVSDATLLDYDDLATLLAGATNEQTTMGRKTLTDADLAAFPAPDDTNDRYDVSLPTVTWPAAAGNAISKIAVCYVPVSGGADSTHVPIAIFDRVETPSGSDIVLSTGVFGRAS